MECGSAREPRSCQESGSRTALSSALAPWSRATFLLVRSSAAFRPNCSAIEERRRMEVEKVTGELFSQLWSAYDDDAFKHSVLLFEQRWRANGEDPEAFRGLRCIDVGCGGGRYSIAMALLG